MSLPRGIGEGGGSRGEENKDENVFLISCSEGEGNNGFGVGRCCAWRIFPAAEAHSSSKNWAYNA